MDNLITTEELMFLLTTKEYLKNKGVVDFARSWNKNMLEKAFGAEIAEKKEEISEIINSINKLLSSKVTGFHCFRYFDEVNQNFYYDLNYNEGTDNPQFIGIGYVDINDLIEELEAA